MFEVHSRLTLSFSGVLVVWETPDYPGAEEVEAALGGAVDAERGADFPGQVAPTSATYDAVGALARARLVISGAVRVIRYPLVLTPFIDIARSIYKTVCVPFLGFEM